jgi:hypothetical protein
MARFSTSQAYPVLLALGGNLWADPFYRLISERGWLRWTSVLPIRRLILALLVGIVLGTGVLGTLTTRVRISVPVLVPSPVFQTLVVLSGMPHLSQQFDLGSHGIRLWVDPALFFGQVLR